MGLVILELGSTIPGEVSFGKHDYIYRKITWGSCEFVFFRLLEDRPLSAWNK